MHQKMGGRSVLKADINVTPLVDVVLVLLIIFMLVTPLLTSPVPIPHANNPAARPEAESRIVVSIDLNGSVQIADAHGSDRLTEAQFPERIKDAFERNPGSTIAIEADAHLSYGDVKKAMLGIRDAGCQNIALIAGKKERA